MTSWIDLKYFQNAKTISLTVTTTPFFDRGNFLPKIVIRHFCKLYDEYTLQPCSLTSWIDLKCFQNAKTISLKVTTTPFFDWEVFVKNVHLSFIANYRMNILYNHVLWPHESILSIFRTLKPLVWQLRPRPFLSVGFFNQKLTFVIFANYSHRMNNEYTLQLFVKTDICHFCKPYLTDHALPCSLNGETIRSAVTTTLLSHAAYI